MTCMPFKIRTSLSLPSWRAGIRTGIRTSIRTGLKLFPWRVCIWTVMSDALLRARVRTGLSVTPWRAGIRAVMALFPWNTCFRTVMPASLLQPDHIITRSAVSLLTWRTDICTALPVAGLRHGLTPSLSLRAYIRAVMPAPSWRTEVLTVFGLATCFWDIPHNHGHFFPCFQSSTCLELLHLPHSPLSLFWIGNNRSRCRSKTSCTAVCKYAMNGRVGTFQLSR